MTRLDLRRALCLEPSLAAILNLMAMVETGLDALKAIERAIILDPANAASRTNRGVILERLGRLDAAIDAHRQAASMAPALIGAWTNLGQCLILAGRVWDAAGALSRGLAQDPADGDLIVNFAVALLRQGLVRRASIWAERATSLRPKDAKAWNSLALARREAGLAKASYEAFQQAVAHAPQSPELHSNRILAANYLPEESVDERALLAAFAALYPRRPRPRPSDRLSSRALRIGYLSADFGRHPVGYFLAGVLENHDRRSVTPLLFAAQSGTDSRTERLRKAAHDFISVRHLDDASLAARVAAERVDILVELSGHGAGNRLGVLAQRAAPLQMSWGGIFGSTGLPAVDVLIADAREIPEGSRGDYLERIARIDPDYVCYAPPEDAPEIGPLPALTSGRFTFGCFNNLVKLNGGVIDLWARILRAAPLAQLLLKARSLDEASVAARIRGEFEGRGVEPSRLRLEGPSAHRDLLAAYGRVDLALDPFPYCGGLTTLEALWMGVPVLSLPGRRFSARHGLTHLSALGLDAFVAMDPDAYFTKALEWTASPGVLSELRQNLRARMAASPLLDAESVARQVEGIYRREWRALIDGLDRDVIR